MLNINDTIADAKFARVLRDHQKIDHLLAQTNTTGGQYLGSILPFPMPNVVAQHVGRDEYVFHRTDALNSILAPDSLVQITYTISGKASVTTVRQR